MSNSMDEFLSGVRSGRWEPEDKLGETKQVPVKEPYQHPDSLFYQKANQEVPKEKFSKTSIVALLLALLLGGGSTYLIQTDQLPPFLSGSVVPSDSGVGEGKLSWQEQQRVALEIIAAWERRAEQAISDYYRALEEGLPHPGLCITTGGKRTCKGPGRKIPLLKH